MPGVKSFSSSRGELRGNPRNFNDPDAHVSAGETLSDRVARLEREKVQKMIDFAKQAQAVRRQDTAYVPLRSAVEEQERKDRHREMRDLLSDGLITQADYDEYRKKEAAEVEKERIEFEKRMADAVVGMPNDWYLRFLLRADSGEIETDPKRLDPKERRRLARYKKMLERARLPKEHALFLDEFLPPYFQNTLKAGKAIQARNEQRKQAELERQSKLEIDGTLVWRLSCMDAVVVLLLWASLHARRAARAVTSAIMSITVMKSLPDICSCQCPGRA